MRGLACALWLVASCSDTGQPIDPGGGGGETFIALQKDFLGYTSWLRFDLGTSVTDGVHIDGARVVYLNRAPAHGSAAFPVGTILVKTIGEGTPTQGKTFAMVKRGGVYNTAGAVGWEWFELLNDANGTPVVVWRGITPPTGEGYSGLAGGACNECHALSRDNDYVGGAALRLAGF